MKISILDNEMFDIHVDREELESIYNAVDVLTGIKYYFIAEEIAKTLREARHRK